MDVVEQAREHVAAVVLRCQGAYDDAHVVLDQYVAQYQALDDQQRIGLWVAGWDDDDDGDDDDDDDGDDDDDVDDNDDVDHF